MDDNFLNELACTLTETCKTINELVINLEVKSKYFESEMQELLKDAQRVNDYMNYLEENKQ